MRRRHTVAIASILAPAVVAGAAAAMRTVRLGAEAGPKVTDEQYAAQSLRLDRYEAQLREAAKQQPPPLPRLPPLPKLTLPPLPSPPPAPAPTTQVAAPAQASPPAAAPAPEASTCGRRPS